MPITIFIIIAILIILFATLYGFRPRYPYFAQKTILTKAEIYFFKSLREAIPEQFAIAPKVRMADIITCTDANWARGYGAKISSKHIDFVLYDRETFEIKLAIELDDKSHQKSDRQKRDQFVNESFRTAQVPLLRVPTAQRYNANELRQAIEEAIKNVA
jgi:hypothetical protein